MLNKLFELAPPLLSLLSPEQAHEATLKSLELGLYPRPAPDHPSLASRFSGLALPNPIGIAAGFDKDACVPDAVLGLGCGFAEVGTLTPREREVFTAIADGLSNREIAHALAISERTVENHRSSVMKKLEAGSLAELARIHVRLARRSATDKVSGT